MKVQRCMMVMCLLGLLLARTPGVATAAGSLEVTGVSPSIIYNDLDATITIQGTNFTGATQVTLGSTGLQDFTVVNDGEISAVVPWGMVPGTYTLTVQTASGTASLPSAVTVKLGLGQWISNGPFGGDVVQILQNPASTDTLYANARNVGVFRSADHGQSWQFVFYTASPDGNLAMDAVNPDLLYATKSGEGLFRSNDGGDTWESIPFPGFTQIYAARAFTHPSTANTVYAALLYGNQIYECGDACGIYRSTDAGDTWVRISADIPNDKKITAIAFGSGYLYAGTIDGIIYRSTDAGDNWVETVVTWDGTDPSTHISKLAVHPDPGSADLFWISEGEGYSGPMYRCAELDEGVISLTCAAVDIDGMEGQDPVMDITFNPTNNQDMLVSGYKPARSTDDGSSWKVYSDPSSPFQSSAVSFDGSEANTAFAGNMQGFYVTEQANLSEDIEYTGTWSKQVDGMTGLVPTYLVASLSQPQSVYVNTDGGGIFHSTDGGANWTHLPNFLDDDDNQYTLKTPLAVDAADDQNLVLGTWHKTVLISENGGQSWTESAPLTLPTGIDAALTEFHFSFIEPVPGAAGLYLAGGHFVDPTSDDYHEARAGGIYRLEVTGSSATWHNLFADETVGRVQAIVFDPSNASKIYCGSYVKAGNDYPDLPALVYSTNGGQTWTIRSPEGDGYDGYQEIRTLTIRPSSGALLADGGSDILFIDPATNTWEKFSSIEGNFGPINRLFYAPALGATPETLYAATTQGLYQSTTGGANWTYASSGLIGANVTAIDYAGSGEQGILYTGVAGGALAASATGQAASQQFAALDAGSDLVDGGVYHLTRIYTKFSLYLATVVR